MGRLLDSVSPVLSVLGDKGKLLLLAATIVTVTLGAADSLRKVRSIPEKMDSTSILLIRHDQSEKVHADSLLAEMRQTRKAHEKDLCLHVAQLSHTNWAHCLEER